MTTNQDQQGGGSLPEPLALDQEVAGLSGSSELALAALALARKHRHVRDPSWRQRLTFLAREPWPLLGVLAVQAGLSLRLVWSNTAFGDEALYLWSGHVEWAHWLHGTPVTDFAAYFSGP